MSDGEELKKENLEKNSPGGTPLNRISTYQDAIKEALHSQEMSSAGMLMAEQKKRDTFKEESAAKSFSNPRNKILLLIAGILIIAAIAFIVLSIINSNKRVPQENSFFMQSKYFLTEKMIEITSAQLSRNTIAKIQQASTEPVETNSITQLVISKEVKADPTSTFDFTKKISYDTNDLLALLAARTPEPLRRTLDQEFMIGVHKAAKNEVFVLFRINNFENAFSSMLTWESALAKDMENIFPNEIARARITTTEEVTVESAVLATTSTSTTPASSTTTEIVQKTIDNTRVWHDRVIRNTDTRALFDEMGQVVFFYAFIDNEYIFFGTKEETFGEVMRRVRSAKLII
ncbi:MAG: hypothetical protein WC087_02070 [Candidatus Paceibacterota bacterium]